MVDSRRRENGHAATTPGRLAKVRHLVHRRDENVLIPQVTPEEAMFIEGKIEAWNIAIGALIAVVGDDDD
jgi:hypothetical protein